MLMFRTLKHGNLLLNSFSIKLSIIPPLPEIIFIAHACLRVSRLHALDGGVVRDDLVKVEEDAREVRDEEPDDDGDEDHGHLVLGAPPLHVRGLLVREGARRTVLAEGRESTEIIRAPLSLRDLT